MRRRFAIFAAVMLLAGCSADWYVRDADRQVYPLVEDREHKTLGYEPSDKLDSTLPPSPKKKAYAEIPSTPIPPPQPSPIEPVRIVLEYGKLGPPPPDELVPLMAEAEPLTEDIQRQALERFHLGPPALGPAVTTLDLIKALEYAAQNSRDYRSQMEDLYLAALQVTLARHLFEPRPFANTGLEYTGAQKDLGYQSALNATAAAGVNQRLPYGGEVTAQALVKYVNALNENTQGGESAEVAISGSIPLLRGAGMVNLEPLIQSERELVYQVRRFEDFRRTFVLNVASSYFRLINQRQSIDNNLVSYINTIGLTLRLQEMFAAGRPGYRYLQVQQAQSRQLSQENAVIQSARDYLTALDDFKVQIGMPVEQSMDVVPVELDVRVPELDKVDYSALALKYRLLLQTARDQIDDAKRKIEVAKNALLPGLDINGNASVGNPTTSPALNFSSSTWQYSAGITLDIPIDRVAERNALRISLIDFERSRRNYEQLRDITVSDVRQSVRSVKTAQSTVEIQRRAIEVARRQLDYANELLTQGQAQARDVTDALQSLLQAQTLYDRARADLQIQVLTLLRDTGTLRVDPGSGALGQAIDLAAGPGASPRQDPDSTGG